MVKYSSITPKEAKATLIESQAKDPTFYKDANSIAESE